MEMTKLFESLQETVGQLLPSLLGALAILIVGWFVAIILRAGLKKGLKLVRLNQYLRDSTGTEMDVEAGVATGLYFFVLLMVLVAFLNALQLELASGSLKALVEQVFAFIPKLVGGGVLLLVAWIVASLARTLITKALNTTTLDEKLSAGAEVQPISESLGNVLYWLVFLFFLPAVLGTLELTGLLEPVQGVVEEILAMLPNVLAAGVIGFVGWFVARIVRDLVSNLLATAGTDQLGDKVGVRGPMTLSQVIALFAYILILVPACIAALQALQIDAITDPATEMLGTILNAIPNIVAAGLILAIAYFIAQIVSNLIRTLLGGMGFDRVPARLGFPQVAETEPTPSRLVGHGIVFFVMLFAFAEAADELGLSHVSTLVSMFIQFGSQVLLGGVIIVVGFWLSTLAHAAILRLHGAPSTTMANVARFAILGLVLAMGLRAMGLADDIVNLAFGLTLGSVAVAVALSFGLGGREAAGKQLEHWLGRMRSESKR